jgi:hypothetical protein
MKKIRERERARASRTFTEATTKQFELCSETQNVLKAAKLNRVVQQ